MEEYDLIVIGSGPAGEKGAEQAAQFGKRVALIERAEYLGGAGINTGTVPSKSLRETALFFAGLKQRNLYGIDYSLKGGLSVKEFMHREHIVVRSERRLVTQKLEEHGVQRFHGMASLKDPHTVSFTNDHGETELKGDRILIASGSSPYHPSDIPFDGRLIFDSDSILEMTRIPKKMVVLGGGVIGVEYASIFAALGVKVTLVESKERILPFIDTEIMRRLVSQLEGIGVTFLFNEKMKTVEASDRHVTMTLETAGEQEFDIALIAAGRESNVQGLGLEEIGIQLGKRGLILVNDKYQTNVPNIYAAGDVIGFPALAATSMEQARVAMIHAFGKDREERLSPMLPFAVYAIPEVSMVGKTEDQCREKGIPYIVGRGYYEDNARGQIIGDMSGMIKLIFSPSDRKLLGVHIIGEQASELIHIGLQLIMADGQVDELVHSVFNYPTLSDLYKAAAHDGLNQLTVGGLRLSVPRSSGRGE
ncbi:MAG: Si-specific NAD(P)(+) transhydrogenase [Anaerolineae bacterium]